MEYTSIGNLIELAEKKNKATKTTNLLGINIDKEFFPSVANVNGTDLSSYKLIENNYFACNPMHVGRDYKLPIALYKGETEAIVSPAYMVFKIKDDVELLPEYLMLWFKTENFDRYMWFKSDSSVRGSISYSDLTSYQIKLISIEEQKKLINIYKSIDRKINNIIENDNLLNILAKNKVKKYIEKNDFESTITIDQYCEGNIKAGGTPNRETLEYWDSHDVPWLKNGEVKNNIILDAEEYISNLGLKNSSAKEYAVGTILLAMYCVSTLQVGYLNFPATSNQAVLGMKSNTDNKDAYLYYYLMYFAKKLEKDANGSAQINLSKDVISKYIIPYDNDTEIEELNLYSIIKARINNSKEIKLLSELKKSILYQFVRKVN